MTTRLEEHQKEFLTSISDDIHKLKIDTVDVDKTLLQSNYVQDVIIKVTKEIEKYKSHPNKMIITDSQYILNLLEKIKMLAHEVVSLNPYGVTWEPTITISDGTWGQDTRPNTNNSTTSTDNTTAYISLTGKASTGNYIINNSETYASSGWIDFMPYIPNSRGNINTPSDDDLELEEDDDG